MAKYKSSRFSSKQFFTMTVLAVSALGLIFVTSAAQKPTNTQSDAAGGCIMKPQVKYVSSESHPDSVNYTLRVWNDSAASCDKVLKYVSVSKPPSGWQMMYSNHVNEGEGFSSDYTSYYFFDDLVPQQKHTVKLEVIPLNQNIKNGTYYLPVKVCRTFPVTCREAYCGEDGTELGERYRIGATDNCSAIKLKYIKD